MNIIVSKNEKFIRYVIDIFFIIDGDSIVSNRIIRPNLLCYTGTKNYKQYDNFYKIFFRI